ncbi:hypothetical protein [Hyphomicrobium zavarzinii]|uniref:hypothetical protein n=1 Tax=Hyphomicrobium zavarzinii TaxID=48292 RepID=UPI00037F66FE|nr:hypothetical protein [Hyphomicrobium zavarzinii]
MGFSADEMKAALHSIARWRADPEAPLACPRCGETGLSLADHSARPYTEWYQLSCRACGLAEMVHIPLGPPVMGGLD